MVLLMLCTVIFSSEAYSFVHHDTSLQNTTDESLSFIRIRLCAIPYIIKCSVNLAYERLSPTEEQQISTKSWWHDWIFDHFCICCSLSISELFFWSSHTQLPLKINCIFPAYIEKKRWPGWKHLSLRKGGEKKYGSFYPAYSMEDTLAHTEALKGGKVTTVKRWQKKRK